MKHNTVRKGNIDYVKEYLFLRKH